MCWKATVPSLSPDFVSALFCLFIGPVCVCVCVICFTGFISIFIFIFARIIAWIHSYVDIYMECVSVFLLLTFYYFILLFWATFFTSHSETENFMRKTKNNTKMYRIINLKFTEWKCLSFYNNNGSYTPFCFLFTVECVRIIKYYIGYWSTWMTNVCMWQNRFYSLSLSLYSCSVQTILNWAVSKLNSINDAIELCVNEFCFK